MPLQAIASQRVHATATLKPWQERTPLHTTQLLARLGGEQHAENAPFLATFRMKPVPSQYHDQLQSASLKIVGRAINVRVRTRIGLLGDARVRRSYSGLR